nr:inner nuclear membrane protein [Ipomoea batatas]
MEKGFQLTRSLKTLYGFQPSNTQIVNSAPKSHSSSLEPSPGFFPTSRAEFLRLVAVISIAASIAFTCNYIVDVINQQPKPFCNSNSEFDDSLSDSCEPCPSNGVCSEGKLECALGYWKLGDLCIEDSKVNEAAKELYKYVEAHVCEEYAQHFCGGTGVIWVSDGVLWLDFKGLDIITNKPFVNAFILSRQCRWVEVGWAFLENITEQFIIKELKCPELLAENHIPLSCRVQQWIVEHALVLLSASALLVGCVIILLKVRRRHYLSVRAEELYNKVCDVLEEKALIARDSNSEGEPWVIASLLRDYLLSPKERKDLLLWKKVEELVREDSRLELYPKVVKGEPKVVWEWQVEDFLSSSGKKKARGENTPLKGEHISFQPKHWASKPAAEVHS